MASVWHKLAAIGGATAVALGAYGAHGLRHLEPTYREVFETANKYHILHGGILMAIAPFTRCAAADIEPGGPRHSNPGGKGGSSRWAPAAGGIHARSSPPCAGDHM